MRDWRWPLLVGGSFVFAQMSGGQLPYALFYVVTILWLSAWLGTRYASRRLQGLVRVDRDRVEVGESVGVRVRVDNISRLPLPWVEVDDHTPPHLVTTEMASQATAIPRQSRREITYKITAKRRGHYPVGPIHIRLGDAFGLFQSQLAFHSESALTVFPRVHHIESLPIPLSQPFGPVRTQERAFEDPANHAEIRQYVPGDNPRHIHWRTSARLGSLMTRQYELSATTQMIIFLDLFAGAQVGQSDREEPSTEETAVEIAASLASLGLRRKIETGLLCHGQERIAVSPGRGQRTFIEILEVLARAQAAGQVPIEQVLERETAHLANHATLVVITPRLTPRLAEVLIRLRVNYQVMLIQLDASSFARAAGAASVGTEPPTSKLPPRQGPGGGRPSAASEVAATTGPVVPLVGLLTLRRIPVYTVTAGADLRLLAEMRQNGIGEGVRSWAYHAPQSVTN